MKKAMIIALYVLLLGFSIFFVFNKGDILKEMPTDTPVWEKPTEQDSTEPQWIVLSDTDTVYKSNTDMENTLPDDKEQAVEAEKNKPAALFIPNVNLPLPNSDLIIQRYEDYPLGGSVETKEAIEKITVSIESKDPEKTDANKYYSVSYDPEKNVSACDFYDSKNIVSGKSLDSKVNFATLKKGEYTFTLTVKTTAEELDVYSDSFTVDWYSYKKLTPANFRNNYACAYEFFGGDIEKFMFGYQMASDNSRNIVVEKSWRKKYLTLKYIFTTSGYVHVDALPYIEKAIDYAENTHLRVRGNGRDSGVVTVADIVESFNGAFVARLVRNDNYVSHHSFGTALDLNAYTRPNTLGISNREIIRTEVRDCLKYNGIVTENGVKYHDFEYSGNHKKYYKGVPYTIQNYLIYELAFYRAGFGWGFYFDHTCDAMHYTLTELKPEVHEGENGLRKVFAYE